VLDHFLAVGGNEIVNSERAFAYAQTSDCPATWLRDPECDTVAEVVGDQPYDYVNIAEAPWYDPDDPDVTGRFLGLYGVDIRGLSDSTREAAVVQKNGDGAVVSGYRHGPREVRVRGWMTAVGGDALEAGMTWLRNALEPNACGQHGGTCGTADSAFFVDCPPERRIIQAYSDWATAATNNYLNPSFEATSGTVETRRNLIPNPEAGTATTLWGNGGVNTGGVTSLSRVATTGPRAGMAMVRKTWTTGETAAGTSATLDVSASTFADAQAVAASTQYTASVYVRSSNVENLRLDVIEYDSGGATTTTVGTAAVMTAGQWSRLSITRTTLATTTKMRLVIRGVTSIQHIASSTWDATMALLETGPLLQPYFSGAQPPRLRENFAPNPRALSTGQAWGSVSSGTSSYITDFPGSVTTAHRWTSTVSNTGGRVLAIPTGVDTPDLGQQAHVYLRLRVAGGTLTDATVAVRPDIASASNQAIVALPDLTPGEHIIDVVTPATDAAIVSGSVSGIVVTGTVGAVGMTIDATAAVVEVAPAAEGDFFDGATAPSGFTTAWTGTANASSSYLMDADMTAAWLGTANASSSYLTAPAPANQATFTSTQVLRWASTQNPHTGTRVARYRMQTAQGAAISTGSFTPVVGQEYTLVMWARANTRDTIVTPRIGNAQAAASVTLPKGVWTLIRVTIVATSATAPQTGLLLTTGSGHQIGDTIDIDSALITQGQYDNGFFDGSTTDEDLNRYAWTGTANASTSTWEARDIYDTPEGDETYFPWINTYRRFLHSVRCISGPFVVQEAESSDGRHLGRLVEFTLLAEVPWVYGASSEIEVPPQVPTVVQDVAYNLAPYPSAELPGSSVIVSTNLSPNPSVEVDATGYSMTIDPVSSPNPATIVTSGRSNDVAAAGTWSYRTRLDASTYANDWGGTAYFDVDTPAVALGSLAAGSRLSFSVWAAALFVAGVGTPETGGGYMHDMIATAIFTGGAGGTVALDGTVDFNGTVFSKKSVAIPAGATSVRVRVRFGLHWSSTSPSAPVPTATDVRCYVDAVAVTIP